MCGSWNNIWHINIISIFWNSFIPWNLGQMIDLPCINFCKHISHRWSLPSVGYVEDSKRMGHMDLPEIVWGFFEQFKHLWKLVIFLVFQKFEIHIQHRPANQLQHIPSAVSMSPYPLIHVVLDPISMVKPTHLSKTLQNFGAPQAPGDAAPARKRETTYQLVLLKISNFNRRPLVGMTCKLGVIPTQMRVKHKETIFQYHSTPLPESLYHPLTIPGTTLRK